MQSKSLQLSFLFIFISFLLNSYGLDIGKGSIFQAFLTQKLVNFHLNIQLLTCFNLSLLLFFGNITNPFLAKTIEYFESDCLTKILSLFWKEAKPEDLARATLVTITNNIGTVHILRKHL